MTALMPQFSRSVLSRERTTPRVASGRNAGRRMSPFGKTSFLSFIRIRLAVMQIFGLPAVRLFVRVRSPDNQGIFTLRLYRLVLYDKLGESSAVNCFIVFC